VGCCWFESHRGHGCLLWVLCVVRWRSLWRSDHSARGVLPTMVRRFVWSRNLVNKETVTHWWAVVGSNPTGGMDVCLLWVLCVVRWRSLWRSDHSAIGVLPTVVRRYVWSRNLVNKETVAHWWAVVGSNPTGGMDVCLLWVLCVVRWRSLRRADHSSRVVLPTVVRRCVWSINLVNEEALPHWGLLRQNNKNNSRYLGPTNHHV